MGINVCYILWAIRGDERKSIVIMDEEVKRKNMKMREREGRRSKQWKDIETRC